MLLIASFEFKQNCVFEMLISFWHNENSWLQTIIFDFQLSTFNLVWENLNCKALPFTVQRIFCGCFLNHLKESFIQKVPTAIYLQDFLNQVSFKSPLTTVVVKSWPAFLNLHIVCVCRFKSQLCLSKSRKLDRSDLVAVRKLHHFRIPRFFQGVFCFRILFDDFSFSFLFKMRVFAYLCVFLSTFLNFTRHLLEPDHPNDVFHITHKK